MDANKSEEIRKRLNKALALRGEVQIPANFIKFHSDLKPEEIMSCLNSGLKKHFLFNGCASEVGSGMIIREMKQEAFSLVYARRIADAKKKIDSFYGGNIRTMAHLKRADKRLYEICRFRLTRNGKPDLDLVSKAFGVTFYSGKLGIYKSIAMRIGGAVEFLNPEATSRILLRYGEGNKCFFDYDRFLEYKNLRNPVHGTESLKGNSYHLNLFSAHRLSQGERHKELRINMCYEIAVIAKSGDICSYKLMLLYIKEILEPSINGKRGQLKDAELKGSISSIIKTFFTTLRDLDY